MAQTENIERFLRTADQVDELEKKTSNARSSMRGALEDLFSAPRGC